MGLLIIAVAVVGMAGAVAPVQLSRGPVPGVDAGQMDELFWQFVNEDKSRIEETENLAPYLGAVARDAQGNVIDSIFAGDGLWYPSVARLNMKYTELGNEGVMKTPLDAQADAQYAEYAANPTRFGSFLHKPDTASGQGVPHGYLVQMSPGLAEA